MDEKALWGLVIVLLSVGILIGIGVTVLDKFAATTEESVTRTNETIAFTSGSGSTAYNDMTALTGVSNMTLVSSDVARDFNWTADGTIVIDNATFEDRSYNVTYTHDAETATSTATEAAYGEISNVSTDWLALIVIISITAIVLGIVMRHFNAR